MGCVSIARCLRFGKPRYNCRVETHPIPPLRGVLPRAGEGFGRSMIRQISLRLISAVPSLIGVVVVTFLLTRMLPGDPAAYFAGLAATPQAIAEIRAKLGLDRS